MRNTFVARNPRIWGKGNIKLARERMGLSQIDLADRIGVRQQRISEWELGLFVPMPAYQRVLTEFFKFTMPDPWNYREEEKDDNSEVQQTEAGQPTGGDGSGVQGSK